MKKAMFCFVVAMLVASFAIPVFAGGFGSPRGREYYLDKREYYQDRERDDLENYKDSLKEKERLLNEEKKALQEQQQYFAPPAEYAEPAPAREVIVTKKYYYYDDFLAGYVLASILCPPWWTPPYAWGWYGWYPGFPYPVYGNVWGGFRGGRIIVNNITTNSTSITSSAFRNHFHNRFGNHIAEAPRHHEGRMQGNMEPRRDSGFGGREQFSGHKNNSQPKNDVPMMRQHENRVAPAPQARPATQRQMEPRAMPQQFQVRPQSQFRTPAPAPRMAPQIPQQANQPRGR